MKKFFTIIIKLRYINLVLISLITAYLGMQIKNLKINPDILSYLPKSDSVSILFEQIGEQYGGNQTAVIGFQTENIFTSKGLNTIKKITETAELTEGVSSVISITNVIDFKLVDDMLEVGKLLEDEIPTKDSVLQNLQHYVLSKELYKGKLVSSDATTSVIAVKLMSGIDKAQLARELKNKIVSLNVEGKLFFGGLPFMLNNVGEIILNDIVFLGPIAFFIIAISLFMGFKSGKGVIMPLLTVSIAIVWTLGVMSLLHYEITIISNISPIILLATGSAYTIHVLNRINETHSDILISKLTTAMAYIIVPVFFASLTTMVGFISFVFGSYLTMISSFGMFTALGIFFSLILSVSFVPSMEMILGKNQNKLKAQRRPVKNRSVFQKMLIHIDNWVAKYPKGVIIIWILIIAVSLIGSIRLERKVDMLDYFKDNNPGKIAENTLKEKFGGTLPIYIKVKGNVQSPKVLIAMKDLQNFMESLPEISNTQSVADLIEEMNHLMGEGKKIPAEERKIFNLWFLLDGQSIMEQLVSPYLDEALIQGTLRTTDSKLMNGVVEQIQSYIDEYSFQGCSFEQTGFPSIYKKLDESLIKSQLQSLIIAIILVFISISLLLKSYVKGILAIVPILVTLIVLFGFMGIVGIPIDVATVLVGSISIGIGVDYAIHFMSHFNAEHRKFGNTRASISNSILVSGNSITINVISVSLGFAVLLFSNLVPLQRFGLLVGVTMLTSGLATLTLLPVLINISQKLIFDQKRQHNEPLSDMKKESDNLLITNYKSIKK